MKTPKRIKFRLVEKDIEKAKKNDGYGDMDLCPIAWGLRRIGKKYVAVYGETAMINAHKFKLNPVAQLFIRRFDARKAVYPINVILTPIST